MNRKSFSSKEVEFNYAQPRRTLDQVTSDRTIATTQFTTSSETNEKKDNKLKLQPTSSVASVATATTTVATATTTVATTTTSAGNTPISDASNNKQLSSSTISGLISENKKNNQQKPATVRELCLQLEEHNPTHQSTSERDHYALFDCLQQLSQIFLNNQGEADYAPDKLFSLYLRPHLSDQNPSVREACLRTYRSAIRTKQDVQYCLNASVHVFVIRALERSGGSGKSQSSVSFTNIATTADEKRKQTKTQQRSRPYLGERIQAYKFIEKILSVAPMIMPKSIVFGVDAVARETNDSLRELCLELLRKLAIVNTKVVAESFGLATLFDAVLDPSLGRRNNGGSDSKRPNSVTSSSTGLRPMKMHDTILLTLLHVANTKKGRKYMNIGPKGGSADFRRLLSPLVDPDFPSGNGDNKEREERWNLSANACVLMMRTWAGLFLLSSDRQGGLRAVFSMLIQPVPNSLRHTILHLMFQFLCIASPKPVDANSVGLRLSVAKFASGSYNGDSNSNTSSTGAADPSLLRHLKYTKDHWVNLSDLIPGAWSPPPPPGVPVGSLTNGGFRRSNTVSGHNVLDNYAASVVLCMLHCGAVEPLVALGLGIDECNGWCDTGSTSEDDDWEDDGGAGLSRPATRILSLIIQTATRLLPVDISSRVLSDLQSLVGTATNRNGTGMQFIIHGGIEEKCERGLSSDRQISSEGVDYPSRARAMLRHLNRSTGLGCFFNRDFLANGGGGSDAAQMLVPIDILSGGSGATKATGAIGFSHLRLAKSLNSQMEHSLIDKTSLIESLRKSKVTMTKEPSEWEWEKIDALLEGPLAYNPPALTECVKNTKFMKRLGGFFRCDPGEKGYFGHLQWTPKNCERYVKIVGQMLNVLLATNDQNGAMYVSKQSRRGGGLGNRRDRGFSDSNPSDLKNRSGSGTAKNPTSGRKNRQKESAGIQFLKTDRRGQLVKEIVVHLNNIIDYIDKSRRKSAAKSPTIRKAKLKRANTNLFGSGSNITCNDGTSLSGLVFSRMGATGTMAREYFTIIGQLSTTDVGLELLEEAGFFSPVLYSMAEDPTKDYLSRQLVSNLDCAYPGPSRTLLQYWLGSSKISIDLRLHCVNVVLRGLLRRGRVVDFAKWGVEMLVTQLQFRSKDMRVASAALCVLNEAACIREYLEAFIRLRPPLSVLETPSAGMLLLRMLTVPSGFLYLHKDVKWLKGALAKWSMFDVKREEEIKENGGEDEITIDEEGKGEVEVVDVFKNKNDQNYTDDADKNNESKGETKSDIISKPNGTDNGCCRYAKHMDEQFAKILMRDRSSSIQSRSSKDNETLNNENIWNNEPIPIPVIAGGGSTHDQSDRSIWLNRNSLGHMVSGSGGESSGSDLDWLMRLPWRIVIWSRDRLGWREVPTDAHLALVTEPGPPKLPGEGDGRDGGTVKYVIRAKALDDTGRPCMFSILDSSTVLRCSLRLGDAHAVHSNGCLHSLGQTTMPGEKVDNKESVATDRKHLSLYSRDGIMGKYTMKNENVQNTKSYSPSSPSPPSLSSFSSSPPLSSSPPPSPRPSSPPSSSNYNTDMKEINGSRALKDAKNECYKASRDPKDLDTDAREEFFWCSDHLRRARMKKEHQPDESGMRVDGSVRVWTVCPINSCAKWKFASANSINLDPDTSEPRQGEPTAMLLSVEYNLDLIHVPVHESARVDLPLHLYGALAACSKESMDYLQKNINLEEIVKLALKKKNDNTANNEDLNAIGSQRHRAALYALGHIGARELGFCYLNDYIDCNIVPKLIQLAETCTTLSLRGSYVSVLGMFSRCAGGTRALIRYGWSIPGPHGRTKNLNKGNSSSRDGGRGRFDQDSGEFFNDDDDDIEEVGEVEGVKYRFRASSVANYNVVLQGNTNKTSNSTATLNSRRSCSDSMTSTINSSNLGVRSNFTLSTSNNTASLVTTSLVALPGPNRIGSFFSVNDKNDPFDGNDTNYHVRENNDIKTSITLQEEAKTNIGKANKEEEPAYVAEALRLFSSLPMTLLSYAYPDFKVLKTRHPELASNPQLLSKVLDMMETYQMPLSVRRYLLGNLWSVVQRTPSSGPNHQEILWSMLEQRRTNSNPKGTGK